MPSNESGTRENEFGRAPKSGRERKAEYDDRQRKGLRVFRVPLEEAKVETFLIEQGFLTSIAADYPDLVAEALRAWIVTRYDADSDDVA